ncbi:Nek5 [Symbiodinium sp. CCMP2592]|nr:Nek5 [Symbiodinium sp. CCMP2592]CAE7335833.1 Nek5 [Symbiodinium sp. CCMP2592]CAE7446535.1 Nek5 [Symbiodinium sp. CCMP2592]
MAPKPKTKGAQPKAAQPKAAQPKAAQPKAAQAKAAEKPADCKTQQEACQTPSQKAAATVSSMSTSPVHNHRRVAADILAPLLDYVEEMEKSDVRPIAYAGIQAFDCANYAQEMSDKGKYTCVAFESDVWPNYGSIVRSYKHHFCTSDGLLTDKICQPQHAGTWEVADKSVFRMGWLMGFAQARETKAMDVVKRFEEASCSVAVTFQLVVSDDEFGVLRRQLEENIKSDALTAQLFGYKECLQTHQVSESLKRQNKPHTSSDVAAWFSKINFAEETIGQKTVECHLKIVKRMTEVAINHLDGLEYAFGKTHPLAKWAALDTLCGKTSCPKNLPLQDKLLNFVVAGIHVRLLRGTLAQNVREDIRHKVIPCFLALRRISHYVAWKIQCKNIGTVFGDWSDFHIMFPRGKFMELAGGNTPEVTAFTEKFVRPSERAAATGLHMLYDGNADHILLKCLSRDSNMSAEGILASSDFASEDLFDLDKILQLHEEETAPPPPPSTTPAAGEQDSQTAASESVVDDGNDSQATLVLGQHLTSDHSVEKPVVDELLAENEDEQVISKENEMVRQMLESDLFPSLTLPSLALDSFHNVSPDAVQNMYSFASSRQVLTFKKPCLTQYATFIEEPDNSKWKEALAQSGGKVDRVLYIYDATCRYDRAALSGKTYRLLPPLDESHYQSVLTSLLAPEGDPSATDTFFRKNDLLFLKDARRSSNFNKMGRIVRQILKMCPMSDYPKKPLAVPVRLCYHNNEFTKDGYVRKNGSMGKITSRIALPDPVENMFVFGKTKCTMETRERKWLDLPGSNYTRSLQGLSIRTQSEANIMVKRDVLSQMMKKVGAASSSSDKAASQPDSDGEVPDPSDHMPGEQQDSQGSEPIPDGANTDDRCCQWFAWSPSELFWAEMFNLYGVRRPGTYRIVDFTPGPGMAALQAVRERVPYVAFCLPSQSDALRQTLTFQIMLEVVRGVNNGFTRRVLSRVRSLDGGHSSNGDGRIDGSNSQTNELQESQTEQPEPRPTLKRKRQMSDLQSNDSRSNASDSDPEV